MGECANDVRRLPYVALDVSHHGDFVHGLGHVAHQAAENAQSSAVLGGVLSKRP